jgi:hypothetical protein
MARLFTSQTPSIADASDGVYYTLGTDFVTDANGNVTELWWYFPSTLPSSTVTASLWSTDSNTSGTLLASKAFVSPTAGQWNKVVLDTPVVVTAGQRYTVAATTPDHYVASSNFFTGALVNGDLTGPANDTGTPLFNGRLHVGITTPTFPDDGGSPSCFFNDITFSPSGQTTNLTFAMSGSGTMAVGLKRIAPLAAAMSGSGTMTATLGRIGTLAVGMSGSGAMAATLTRIGMLGFAMSGSGRMTVELAGASLLPPNNELVARAWLSTVVGLESVPNGTELPEPGDTDAISWQTTGFLQVGPNVGGSPDRYVPMRQPIVQVQAWTVTQGSRRPPWNQALSLAERVVQGTYDGYRFVQMPIAGYQNVLVHGAWCSEPRRLPRDPGNYGRVQMDLSLAWTAVPS